MDPLLFTLSSAVDFLNKNHHFCPRHPAKLVHSSYVYICSPYSVASLFHLVPVYYASL